MESEKEIHRVAHISLSGGNKVYLDHPFEENINIWLLDVSSDGQRLLVKAAPIPGGEVWFSGTSLWEVPVYEGAPRRLGGVTAQSAVWTPDGGGLLLYGSGGIWLARGDGAAPRKIGEKPGLAAFFLWSPDRSRVRFTWVANVDQFNQGQAWELFVKDGSLGLAAPGWDRPQHGFGGWIPNTQYSVFRTQDGHLWLRREDAAGALPVRLTAGALEYSWPTPTISGESILAVGTKRRGRVFRWNPESQSFELHLAGLSADSFHFTRDGAWMIYVTYPEGELWRSRADGSDALQLTFRPMKVWLPAYSPEGKYIAFAGVRPGGKWKLYRVSHDGGRPEQLLPGDGPEVEPTWSPDGTKIAFAARPYEEVHGPLYLLDIDTRQCSEIPASDRFFGPRWSPDGRYLVALDDPGFRPHLYDFETGAWKRLAEFSGGFPNWSSDGRYVFVHGLGANRGVYRLEIASGQLEMVASYGELRMAGNIGPWGLYIDPEDRPIVLENVGEQDIYALDLKIE